MSSDTHRMAILTYDGVTLLELAGPAEVPGEADPLGAGYRIALGATTVLRQAVHRDLLPQGIERLLPGGRGDHHLPPGVDARGSH
ncbi:hypothetical protein [Streptomyces sp. NPDC046759]|uniref:hypothetical protein n=1 Tax=Streptomyces sp. NPDC046759 TaxID=3155019 RepID=UPI0033F45AB3